MGNVAGRVDCIAEFNGKLSVIDFKPQRKRRRKSGIENYFIQPLLIVKCMKNNGQPIDQIVILIVTEEVQLKLS